MYILQLTPHYQKPESWNEASNNIISEHFNYLSGLHQQGVMKLVGKTDYGIDHPQNRGYAIFEAENLEKAKQIMNNDPCIVKGVMTAELHPFRIALG